MDEAQLMDILTVSRDNNLRANITGILLYSDGTFIQVLEGDKNTLDDTFEKIKIDKLHRGIIKIAAGELKERNFKEWTMGFKSFNSDILNMFGGYVNPSDDRFLNDKPPHAAISVIKTFCKANRITTLLPKKQQDLFKI